MDRLETFRAFMRRLDVTDPLAAIQSGMYVPYPDGTVADRIASTATLRPYASQVLVGGIGAGKSTQLLVARDRIEQMVSDTWPIYIDVSEKHRLEELTPGVLVALAALEIERRASKAARPQVLPPEVRIAAREIRGWAHGRHVIVEGDDSSEESFDDDNVETVFEPGLIKPRERLNDAIRVYLSGVRVLRDALPNGRRNVLMLFDSLDRISNLDAFTKVVEQDLQALRELEIGAVMTAPLQAMFGANRVELERFDVQLHQPAVDAADDASGRVFLMNVLSRRASDGFLSAEACEQLALLSGGVLRDLIALARAAAEEAFLHGADTIEADHVASAADRFGRKRMLGLRSNELVLLDRVHRTGRFVPTTDSDLALLVTRRIIEYHEEHPRFAVHPTLVPLLKSIKGAA